MDQAHAIISILLNRVPNKYEAEIKKCGIFEKRTLYGYATETIIVNSAYDITKDLLHFLDRVAACHVLLKQITQDGAEAMLYITQCSNRNRIWLSAEVLARLNRYGLSLGVD